MSLWTLAEVNEMIDGLKNAMLCNPTGVGTVSIAGRTITYNSFEDLKARIMFLAREKATLERKAAGGRRISYAVGKFN